uniref:Putative ovule protein n=1 Tax=Solanum chacoense TaxID=4108 RepID=A0A0V0HCI1_SOLCH
MMLRSLRYAYLFPFSAIITYIALPLIKRMTDSNISHFFPRPIFLFEGVISFTLFCPFLLF